MNHRSLPNAVRVHASLFPPAAVCMKKIRAGLGETIAQDRCRSSSGTIGKKHVHFEAPEGSSSRRGNAQIPALVRDRFRHRSCMEGWHGPSRFVTIHPFDDGNGRIARAIADLALARSENSPQRFYSVSAQIGGAAMLLRHSGGNPEGDDGHHAVDGLVPRLPRRAIGGAQLTLSAVLAKARFWERIKEHCSE